MPMLPSGRHVAVEFDQKILEHLKNADVSSVPWVMALQQPDDSDRFDIYDLLAALDRFANLAREDEPSGKALNRTICMWLFVDQMRERFPDLQNYRSDDVITQAKLWRERGCLDVADGQACKALREHAIKTAVMFWDGWTDEALRARDLQAWKILQLVIISPEADSVFAGASSGM